MYKRLETPFAVQRWDLLQLDAPDGTRDPIVLHSDAGARAVLVVLQPGQSLGDHQVKENAWVTVLDGTVQISAGGDTAAFQILYERYRDPIFRFTFRLLGSVEAAEDDTHDCFLSLMKAPGRFDSTRASLRTYIYAAARNLATKRYHSAGRETACPPTRRCG